MHTVDHICISYVDRCSSVFRGSEVEIQLRYLRLIKFEISEVFEVSYHFLSKTSKDLGMDPWAQTSRDRE